MSEITDSMMTEIATDDNDLVDTKTISFSFGQYIWNCGCGQLECILNMFRLYDNDCDFPFLCYNSSRSLIVATGVREVSYSTMNLIIILDKCISLFCERERPVIQPPVAAVVRLEAAEGESLSPRKFPWKLASTADV